MIMHRWWDQDPTEIYWLEITNRPDVGNDLHAPSLDDSGAPSPSYQLVTEVKDGEVVFHYEKEAKGITSWSVAEGGFWEAETVWGTPRSTGRSGAPVEPYVRDGLWHGLRGPYPLKAPLGLEELRGAESRLREIHGQLAERYSNPLYLAFQLRSDGVRASQGYLQKLPAEIVSHFGQLRAVVGATHHRPSGGARQTGPGDTYRPALAPRLEQPDPFSVDPSVVERGLMSHARLQNFLVEILESHGRSARSPGPSDAPWDVLWVTGDEIWVAEVKSLTDKNEERQLRLGLGQLLRYRQRLSSESSSPVRGLMLVEREPTDPTWIGLCESLDIQMLWPSILREGFPR
jgi:hypothetical protein